MFGGDQRAHAGAADFAQPWLEANQAAAQSSVALRQGQEGVAEADQAARGDLILQAHIAVAIVGHVDQLGLAGRQRLS